MANIETAREARRKKILEMSEIRMSRVMGTIKHDEKIDKHVTQEPSPVEDIKQNTLDDGTTGVRQRYIPLQQTSENSDMEDIARPVRNTVKVAPLKKPVAPEPVLNIKNGSHNTSHTSIDAKMMLKHFEFLRIVLCVMLAYLCRRMLSAGYGMLYFESFVLPFAALETGFFMFKHKLLHNVILLHRSSKLIGVLMLCGINPTILQTYNTLMGYFTAVMEDFALFFFAFMMANAFIT